MASPEVQPDDRERGPSATEAGAAHQGQRPFSDHEVLGLLSAGRVEVLGRIPWGSNATLLADVFPPGDDATGDEADDRDPAPALMQAVYKPRKGERPLWDFPAGLDRREVAAYELSRALGWDIVPQTVLRNDLPFGTGSLQRFVPFDPAAHYFTLLDDPQHHDILRQICCFDLVSNQADRKGGHCLLAEDGRVWAVDNGLSFHREPKLRTVIWDFAGEPIPERLRDDLGRLARDGLPEELQRLLDRPEQAALLRRAELASEMQQFPDDPTSSRYPWPPI